MAANYWESTQRRNWQYTREQLADVRKKLEEEEPNLVQMYPLPQIRHMSIYFNQRECHVETLALTAQENQTADRTPIEIARLGKRLGVRQQAMATAQVYIRRFYTRVDIRRTNPYLVIATAVYLACKMEECPHHIRLLVAEARTLWPGKAFLIFYRHPDTLLILSQTSSAVTPQSLGSASFT